MKKRVLTMMLTLVFAMTATSCACAHDRRHQLLEEIAEREAELKALERHCRPKCQPPPVVQAPAPTQQPSIVIQTTPAVQLQPQPQSPPQTSAAPPAQQPPAQQQTQQQTVIVSQQPNVVLQQPAVAVPQQSHITVVLPGPRTRSPTCSCRYCVEYAGTATLPGMHIHAQPGGVYRDHTYWHGRGYYHDY